MKMLQTVLLVVGGVACVLMLFCGCAWANGGRAWPALASMAVALPCAFAVRYIDDRWI